MAGNAGTEPVRRSARGRVVNKKYSIDPFEGLDFLESDSEATSEELAPVDNPEKDQDFAFDQVAGEEAEDDAYSSNGNASDESRLATPLEHSDDARSDEDIYNLGQGPQPLDGSVISIRPQKPRIRRVLNGHLHSRGLAATSHKASKSGQLKYLVGTDPKDLLQFVQSRDKWIRDVTFPSREPKKDGSGGMAYHSAYTAEIREREATVEWDWYYVEGGRRVMEAKQNMKILESKEATKYLACSNASHRFLMGPYGAQKMSDLSVRQGISIAEAWPTDSAAHDSADQQKRRGWILNAGTKVRCVEWAPNHHGNTQYLAVCTSSGPPADHEPHTAFVSSKPYQSSIQIWALRIQGSGKYGGYTDTKHPPRIVQYVCTNWGAAQQFRWCPIARGAMGEEQNGKIFVGLLAGIWTDGYVRVLSIQLDKTSNASSVFVKYQAAAFESKPPSTICTCIAWFSATTIAAGCANGFVAIWDIRTSILPSKPEAEPAPTNSPTSPPSARPTFYKSLHQSYIVALVSTYPSHPHFLATSSMDGHLRLTDLRCPQADFVLSPRMRIGPSALAFHTALESIVAPEDSDFVRVYPLRRFWSTNSASKSEAQILSLAVGKVHACLLAGAVDGTVIATNPLLKIVFAKSVPWQQTWFRHEWVPAPLANAATVSCTIDNIDNNTGMHNDDDDDNTAATAVEPPLCNQQQQQQRRGISRFSEGYKPVCDALHPRVSKRGQGGGLDTMPFVTIYEEETAITQVAWNPNLTWGGWAAAGMGSGLVRVEDLAI